ncbi:unnamed protein product, partial [Urochloa humidicola]
LRHRPWSTLSPAQDCAAGGGSEALPLRTLFVVLSSAEATSQQSSIGGRRKPASTFAATATDLDPSFCSGAGCFHIARIGHHKIESKDENNCSEVPGVEDVGWQRRWAGIRDRVRQHPCTKLQIHR